MVIERFPDRETKLDETLLKDGLNRLPAVLSDLGFASLRAGQDKVVYSLMGGLDTICVLPTGAGKSLCFTVPTLCNGWRTLVFSPLVALMRDQVQSAWRKGIAAAQISSTQSDGENIQAMKDWSDGKISLLYVAPERTENPMFKTAIQKRKPDFCVLDEVHVMSDAGDSFRPSYKKVGDFIREINPRVVGAFSATLPEDVEADIRNTLGMRQAVRLRHYPRRNNLLLSSSNMESEMEIVNYVRKNEGSTIIYCSTIKRLEALTGTLQAFLDEPVGYFHGELPPSTKRSTQDAFMEDKIRVMVATNAFGMGIDKPDCRHVLQRDIEASIEATAQILGRAGRDGEISHCHTFYSDESLRTQQFFLASKYPDVALISAVYDSLCESADNMGRTTASFKDIANRTGIPMMTVNSVVAILSSDHVIKRSTDKDTTARIRYIASSTQDPRFEKWKDAVYEGGVPDGDSVEVELDWLAETLGYTSNATVKKWLGQWASDGLIAYQPPRAYPPLEITGTLQNIDFARLAKKAANAIAKLADVVEYCRTPDDAKHSFMEERFGVERK